MKIGDVQDYYSYEYLETCEECGKVHRILTQQSGPSEYETEVYVTCDCGDLVWFTLPVN
jgi:RNase P subunit RPR2